MAESAFIVPVPEAEARVGALRHRFDASVHQGVPAHITILVPFMAPEHLSATVLAEVGEVLCQLPAFAFALTKVARFPATAYLQPEPPQPFIALTQALVRRFPAFPPFRGEHASIVPHLTVAHGDAGEAALAAAELEATMREAGPIHSACTLVSLIENSSGVWKQMHAFGLRSSSV